MSTGWLIPGPASCNPKPPAGQPPGSPPPTAQACGLALAPIMPSGATVVPAPASEHEIHPIESSKTRPKTGPSPGARAFSQRPYSISVSHNLSPFSYFIYKCCAGRRRLGAEPFRQHRAPCRTAFRDRPQQPGMMNSGRFSLPVRYAATTASISPQTCASTRMPTNSTAARSPCEIAPQIRTSMPRSRRPRTFPSGCSSDSTTSLRSTSASPSMRTRSRRVATSKTGDTRP